MVHVKRFLGKNSFYLALLILYIVINSLFLTRFPFVHSDESWLAGLSRNISETGSYSVTESFFDLKPRYPHAIKILFHTLQIPTLKLLGYGIFSVRLLSLLFGALTLFFFFKLCRLILGTDRAALTATVLLAADIQFIYASHFARQEIILVFILVSTLLFFLCRVEQNRAIHNIATGAFIGLSIGIHPNSFIISLPFILVYMYYIIIKKSLKFKDLVIYISTVAFFAAVFVSLSLYFNPNFFTDYASYGNEFEVFNPLSSKLAEVKDFYLKLYDRVSGTYYTPDIRFQLVAFAVTLLLTLCKLLFSRNRPQSKGIIPVILTILAVNAGIIAIGRYNQTSIVLQFPFFYILLAYLLKDLGKIFKYSIALLFFAILLVNTVTNILPYTHFSYERYLMEISKAVSKDDTVLANLNTDFYFENGKLKDYRNLAYLKKNNLTFEQYIENNGIKYIIYSEELDFIYSQRPVWNGIYGNPSVYYNDMKGFLQTDCKPVHEFIDRTYGIRIARYINAKDWKIVIYQVLQ